jgi:hypothetical protein
VSGDGVTGYGVTHLTLELLLVGLERLDPRLHVRLALLRLQRLAHAERDRRLVQRLRKHCENKNQGES